VTRFTPALSATEPVVLPVRDPDLIGRVPTRTTNPASMISGLPGRGQGVVV